jgi:hypothetical protein
MNRPPRTLVRLLVPAVAVIGMAACGGDDDGSATPTSVAASATSAGTATTGPAATAPSSAPATAGPATSTADTADAAGGVVYTAPDGSYRATFPEQPSEQTRPQPLPTGDSMDLHIAGLELDDSFLATAHGTYPEGTQLDPAAALQGAQDQAIANVKGTLIDGRDITLQGRLGREFSASIEASGTSGTVLQRVYLDGTTIYEVIRTGAGELSFGDPASKAFFDSFSFTS